jgi:hypothetical protein
MKMPCYPKRYGPRKGGTLDASKAVFERWLMPYGKWTCGDGREVLFDRDYAPICERYPGEPARAADSGEWVRWNQQDYVYGEKASEKAAREAAEAVLLEWGYLHQCMADIAKHVAQGR